jgi:hypothetical protein
MRPRCAGARCASEIRRHDGDATFAKVAHHGVHRVRLRIRNPRLRLVVEEQGLGIGFVRPAASRVQFVEGLVHYAPRKYLSSVMSDYGLDVFVREFQQVRRKCIFLPPATSDFVDVTPACDRELSCCACWRSPQPARLEKLNVCRSGGTVSHLSASSGSTMLNSRASVDA